MNTAVNTAMSNAFQVAKVARSIEIVPEGKRQVMVVTFIGRHAVSQIAIQTRRGRRYIGKPRTWKNRSEGFFKTLAEKVLR